MITIAGKFRQFVTVNGGLTTAKAYFLVPLSEGKPAVFKVENGDPRLKFVDNAEVQALSGMVSGVAAAAFLNAWPTTNVSVTLTGDGALPTDFNSTVTPNFGKAGDASISWNYSVFNPATGATTPEGTTVAAPATTASTTATDTTKWYQKTVVKIVGWGLLIVGAGVGLVFAFKGGKKKSPARHSSTK